MKLLIWFDRLHLQDASGRGLLLKPVVDEKTVMTDKEIETFLYQFGEAIKAKKVKVSS